MNTQNYSHSRRNILTDEWVLVSPHRTERPWQGRQEEVAYDTGSAYESDCYLCPGNSRANGANNPQYEGTFVFDNDYPALSESSLIDAESDVIFDARPEAGLCRVVCYCERHDLRMSTMSEAEVTAALEAMFSQFMILDENPAINYVQIFENRGEQMGCSNQHPHAQIWATENLPNEAVKELATQTQYFEESKTVMLLDYLAAELRDGRRVVLANADFVVLVPYWAVWPFEVLILPRRQVTGPDEMTKAETISLAQVIMATTAAYNRLFETEMPYSMGFHARPSDGGDYPAWQFHAHIYPPLLRSATVRKHLVGFEMLAMPQRDLTPEVAAQRLRDLL